MIHHVVMIRLQPSVSAEEQKEFLVAARELLQPIPGVTNLHVGQSAYSDAPHPLCLVMDFEDVAALEAYQVHPDHQRFVHDVLGPILEDKLVVDYDC